MWRCLARPFFRPATAAAGAVVLMQKPMGEDYEAAGQILDVTRRMQMIAGLISSFDMRLLPMPPGISYVRA